MTNAKGKPSSAASNASSHARSLAARKADAGRPARPAAARGGDPRPFEVVGIPLGEPGYHVVEIESLRLGQSLLDKRAPMFVRTGVLVTNLGVHFKLGRENSLVWVTTLDRGQPVEAPTSSINDCNGKTLWTGRSTPGHRTSSRTGSMRTSRTARPTSGCFVTARNVDAKGGARASTPLRLRQLAEGHRGLAPQRADRRRAEPDLRALDGLRPHAAFAPARRSR